MEKYEYERAKYRRENVSKYSNSMRQKCERLPKMYFKLTFKAKKLYECGYLMKLLHLDCRISTIKSYENGPQNVL